MSRIDPIESQILLGALHTACEEMGAVLIRSSHSANVKERHDCSTALFDPRGELVMQAEHIPVHLGSMPDAVAAVLDEDHSRGASWILNDPFRGGTHLPDITLVQPILDDGALLGFAASRAHHADVGGPTPGGMPADSRTLQDEGVVIAPTRVEGSVLEDLAGRMRNPSQRLADLRAQAAANHVGAEAVLRLAERLGRDGLEGAFAQILDYAEARARETIAALPDGAGSAEDVLEDDAAGELRMIPLRVEVRVRGEEMEVDFTGSSEQVGGNLNCPLPVTRSAALFAVKALTDPDAPPSAGANRPVRVIAPEGSLLNARAPAAVVAGNVETSGRVSDLVTAALAAFVDAPAQGQGTMNNLTLAGEGFTYYETTGGGQGAGPDLPGPSAIHVAMSNTLNTPVEALETEFPLRVGRLEVRRGSGGAGARPGGDGIVREIEALAPMSYSLITERRAVPPAGRDGGGDGAPGLNTIDGRALASKASGSLAPGQRIRVETPGGGGHGQP